MYIVIDLEDNFLNYNLNDKNYKKAINIKYTRSQTAHKYKLLLYVAWSVYSPLQQNCGNFP